MAKTPTPTRASVPPTGRSKTDTSSQTDPLPSARTHSDTEMSLGDTNAPASNEIEAMDYAQVQAAITTTQGRLNVLTDHRTSLEVAYKRGTHWPGVIANAFTSDDGVRVAWLSGSRLINLSGVGDSTPRDNVRHEHDRVDGLVESRGDDSRDPRTGEANSRLNLHDDNILHEHRTGEGGLIVEGGVSRTVARTAVDHENTTKLGAFKSHVDARRLTISVNGKIYNHVDETPDGHWVYRFDK